MNILNFLITIGSIALCIGLALIGLQFLCSIVLFVVMAVWGIVGAIIKFLTTKQ